MKKIVQTILIVPSPHYHSYDAIGLSGLCWMSALVSALAYGFVLELVPDVREASSEYLINDSNLVKTGLLA